MYAQGKVCLVGRFPQEQMLNMSSDGYGAKSPDRLDALLGALSALMLAPQRSFSFQELRL